MSRNFNQKALLHKINQIALKTNQELLKNSKSEKANYKRQLTTTQKKLEKSHLKEEKKRLNCVKAARHKRTWDALDAWIREKLEENPLLNDKQLWNKLPNHGSNSPIYKEGEKIHCPWESRESIQYQAFTNHVKLVKSHLRK